MTELKTIKDLNEDFLQKKGYEIFPPAAMKILKKEAIKEMKEIEKNYIKENTNNSIYERGLIARGKIDYIKWKNNITEEDLNEWKKHEPGDPQTSTGK